MDRISNHTNQAIVNLIKDCREYALNPHNLEMANIVMNSFENSLTQLFVDITYISKSTISSQYNHNSIAKAYALVQQHSFAISDFEDLLEAEDSLTNVVKTLSEYNQAYKTRNPIEDTHSLTPSLHSCIDLITSKASEYTECMSLALISHFYDSKDDYDGNDDCNDCSFFSN